MLRSTGNICLSLGQVLPILLKIGGRLIPAPTQLVPESGSGMDAGKVLDSLSAALKGCIPDPGCQVADDF